MSSHPDWIHAPLPHPQIDQLGLKSSSDKDKYDTDSLAGQEGLMEKSTDSLETDKKYSVVDEKEETDSLYDEDERPKQTDIMQTSIDSLESSKSRSIVKWCMIIVCKCTI